MSPILVLTIIIAYVLVGVFLTFLFNGDVDVGYGFWLAALLWPIIILFFVLLVLLCIPMAVAEKIRDLLIAKEDS